MTIAPLIRKLEILGPLPDEGRRVPEDLPLCPKPVAADRDLIREGERATHCLLLLDGFACRYKLSEDGVRQIVGFHIPGDFVDLTSLLLGRMDHSVAAVTAVEVAAIPHAKVVGPTTNLGLLRAIAEHPAFAAAELDTGFIARHAADLLPSVTAEPGTTAVDAAVWAAADAAVWAAAALTVVRDQGAAIEAQARATGDPWSPWTEVDAWRMNGDGYQDLRFRRDDAPPVTLRARPQPDGSFRLDLPAGSVHAALSEDEAGPLLLLDGVSRRLRVVRRGAELTVILAGRNHALVHEDPLAPPRTETAGSDRVTAPVPGRATRVLVRHGEVVAKNAPLVVIEAMKMEITLRAPLDGTVAQVRHAVDDMVEEGTELVTFAAEAQQS